MPEVKKREVAYKLRIGDIIRGNQIYEETEGMNKRLKFVEVGAKQVVRVNIIANVVDKYESSGESRFASLTIDDGSGQIRLRVFGDDLNKFEDITQGDTLVVIGLLRSYNQELYIMPEVIKKQDPKYLLVRKLEIDKAYFKEPEIRPKQKTLILRDEILTMIRDSESNEGINKEEIIMKVKSPPELINQEIQKLLEEGIIYEPRPGKVRYLG